MILSLIRNFIWILSVSVLFSAILATVSKPTTYLDEFSENASGNLSKDLCVIERHRCNFFYKFPKCHTTESRVLYMRSR